MKTLNIKLILLGVILAIVSIAIINSNSNDAKDIIVEEASLVNQLLDFEASSNNTEAYYGSADEFKAEFVGLWKTMKAYTAEVAGAMPADKYNFKPTDEVRSFGQQMKHLSYSSQFFIKVFFKGEMAEFDPTAEETAMSKEEIVPYLNAAFDSVLKAAENITDESLNEMVEIPFIPTDPKPKLSRRQMFNFIRDHVTHHRGQAIVYLRMNGITPPSYRAF